MNATLDYTTRTIEGAAAACGPIRLRDSQWTREPRSVSGTSTCRGCSDPQCGYCEERVDAERPMRIAAETQRIIADGNALRELFVDLEWDNPDAVAGILRAAVTGDYIKAGERISNLLTPRINAMAQERAA